MSAIDRPVSPPAPPPEGLRRFAAPLACLAIAGFAAWFYATVPVGNVDVGWLLVVGERILDGARLHVDIVEINPPFSVWLYLPFLLAEQASGLRAEFWIACGLPAFALLSVWLFVRILHQGRIVVRPWLMPAMLVVLLCLFPRDFGQREQFGVIALLPWLALQAARDRNSDFAAGTTLQRVLAGFGAALFVAIKPPMAVFALAVPALWLSIQRRSIRPLFTAETLLGATVMIAYLASLALFHRAFFTDILPTVRELYLPMRMSVSAMLMLGSFTTFVVFAATIFIAAMPGRIDRVARLLLLAGVGYVPCFVLMGKGWTYQALPSLMLVILALLVQLSRPRGESAQTLFAKAGAAVGLVLIAQIVVADLPALRNGRAPIDAAAAAIDAAIPHPTVVSIATRLQPAHPLTRVVGGRYLARDSAFWWSDNAAGLIAATADAGRRQSLEALRDRYVTDTAREFVATRPDIIVDGGSRPTLGQPNVHGNPVVARLLESYRVLYRDVERTIWLRADIAPPSAGGSSPAR